VTVSVEKRYRRSSPTITMSVRTPSPSLTMCTHPVSVNGVASCATKAGVTIIATRNADRRDSLTAYTAETSITSNTKVMTNEMSFG
jgi:hypothetical protein